MKGDQIRFRKGFKYQLYETYGCATSVRPEHDIIRPFYEIHSNGVVIGKAGYAWDGPSGPTFDTPDSMRGSLIHDIFYQAMREGLLPLSFRDAADLELETICDEDGMPDIRSEAWHQAVSLFAEKNARPGTEKIYIAPNTRR